MRTSLFLSKWRRSDVQARDLVRLDPGDRRAKSVLLRLRLEQRLAAIRAGFK